MFILARESQQATEKFSTLIKKNEISIKLCECARMCVCERKREREGERERGKALLESRTKRENV